MKRELLALLVLLGVLVGGWVGYRLIFEGLGARELTLESVQGDVRHGAGKASDVASAGEVINPGERLEAGPDGAAVLSFGPDTRVALRADSAIKVVAVEEDGVRLALENGRVQATVREGGASVGVAADGREVTARNADVNVSRDADGTVAVEPLRGAVELDGFGRPTRVGEGERLVAPAGGAARVIAAGQEALLSLASAPPATNQPVAQVTGTTEPLATVTVSGGVAPVTVKADADGRFAATVQLVDGDNPLTVRAVDVFGRVAQAPARITLDRTPPHVQSLMLHAGP